MNERRGVHNGSALAGHNGLTAIIGGQLIEEAVSTWQRNSRTGGLGCEIDERGDEVQAVQVIIEPAAAPSIEPAEEKVKKNAR